MNLTLKLIVLFLLFNTAKGYSQNYYKFKSHEMWKIDAAGKKYSDTTFSGTLILEYLRIDPHYSIEMKLTNQDGKLKSLWKEKSVDVKSSKFYTYELLNTFSQGTNDPLYIELFFDLTTDKLFKVYIMFQLNGQSFGCYLNPELQ